VRGVVDSNGFGVKLLSIRLSWRKCWVQLHLVYSKKNGATGKCIKGKLPSACEAGSCPAIIWAKVQYTSTRGDDARGWQLNISHCGMHQITSLFQ